MPLLEGAAAGIIGAGLGLALEKHNDRRQIKQQGKLQEQQISGQKQMTDYNISKQLQMWKDTSYGAQKTEMQKAGLNPALMYGMGGGGGQSTGNASGTVNGGNAPQGGGEAMGMIQQQMNLQLLKAQKENIEADTENKKSGTLETNEKKTALEYENIIKDLLVNRDKDGNMISDEAHDKDRVAFRERIANLDKVLSEIGMNIDENKRREVMNNATIQKVGNEIELMKIQGKNIKEITENLKKEGIIKDMQIEWGKMGLTMESLTKFIQMLIMKAL